MRPLFQAYRQQRFAG